MGLLPYGTLGQGRFQTEEGFKEREKNNPGRKMKPANEQVSAAYPFSYPITGNLYLKK
jgi:hypothetical protein